jgi:hypothetical protein
MLSAPKAWEAPLADFKNERDFKAWLRDKPREVAVAFAARAALRVLPLAQEAKREGYGELVLPVFRATGVAWAAAKYPAHATRFAAAAGDPSFFFNADAARPAAARAAEYAVCSAADRVGDVGTYADYAAGAATAAGNAANSSAAMVAAHVGWDDVHPDDAEVAPAFWSAVSIDATQVEQGKTASEIAGSPLWPKGLPPWPNGQPEQLKSLWEKMKVTLHTAELDWRVWTIWYEDRLAGRVREEERELAYVRIEQALWDQGPAIVNAEIKRRIEEHRSPEPVPPEPGLSLLDGFSVPGRSHTQELKLSPVPEIPPALPAPIENVPSAVSFGWTSKGTVTVVLGELNWPAFLFKGGEQDQHRLEACRSLATDTAQSLRSGRWNARQDYVEILNQYAAYLPVKPEEGNFLLADAEARIIRGMFASDADILPMPLAERLKVFLQHHIGLRAYYPATEDFYESVRSGHLEAPLPIDAVEGFIQGVRDNTPTLFELNVSQSLEGVAQPIPTISPIGAEAPKSDGAQPMPPPDPLGEVDPEKARRYTIGGAINALWKAVLSGKKIDDNVESWVNVAKILGPKVAKILDWLQNTLYKWSAPP